ncbi:MAG TPA: hypothetical protein VFZ10_16285 [Geminicoccaceae bacterium]
MIRRLLGMSIVVLVCALRAEPARTAEDPLEGDLRGLRVGMTVAELPSEGYVDLACGGEGGAPGPALASWAEFARCRPDAAGLHEVTFAYAESPLAELGDRWEGTKVAGHPVIPSLLIDETGVVQGIRVVTDPEARMYLKKKAFLLGIRVMGRYGRDGWTCTEAGPGAGRTPVGGMFIDRHCEKVFHDRRLVLETDLYRTAEQQGQEFTGSTRLEIFRIAG